MEADARVWLATRGGGAVGDAAEGWATQAFVEAGRRRGGRRAGVGPLDLVPKDHGVFVNTAPIYHSTTELSFRTPAPLRNSDSSAGHDSLSAKAGRRRPEYLAIREVRWFMAEAGRKGAANDSGRPFWASYETAGTTEAADRHRAAATGVTEAVAAGLRTTEVLPAGRKGHGVTVRVGGGGAGGGVTRLEASTAAASAGLRVRDAVPALACVAVERLGVGVGVVERQQVRRGERLGDEDGSHGGGFDSGAPAMATAAAAARKRLGGLPVPSSSSVPQRARFEREGDAARAGGAGRRAAPVKGA
ncbi:hypothetical protein HK405_007389, partial [Cladochytrium tenue]